METNKKCSLTKRVVVLVAVASLVSASVQAVNAKHAAIARKTRSVNAAGESMHTRAPRPEAPTALELVSPDSSLLADIASCCCNLTNIVIGCCSVIGSLTDQGICDASRWSTEAGIQSAEQTVIAWLKTIMIELRGLCQPTP